MAVAPWVYPLVALPYVSVVILLILGFVAFAWWDRRKPPEERDAWGPWGFLLPASVFALGAALFVLTESLLIGLGYGFDPFRLYLVALAAGMAFVTALFIQWSVQGHRRRFAEGLAT
ncbi:MAG: hypothetical protein ACE5IJ_07320 [Thermoplasmata archaeon]